MQVIYNGMPSYNIFQSCRLHLQSLPIYIDENSVNYATLAMPSGPNDKEDN